MCLHRTQLQRCPEPLRRLLIQSLLRDEDDVKRAAAHQQKLEALVMKAGGITGPGSIGDPYDIGEGR